MAEIRPEPTLGLRANRTAMCRLPAVQPLLVANARFCLRRRTAPAIGLWSSKESSTSRGLQKAPRAECLLGPQADVMNHGALYDDLVVCRTKTEYLDFS